MSNEVPFLLLRWHSEESVEVMGPDEFVYSADGKIVSADELEREEMIGKFRIYYADLAEAANEGIPAFDVMDAHSQTTAAFYEGLYAPDHLEFTDEVLRLFNHDVFGMNLLILDRLELLPRFRGEKLGLVIMRRLIQRFSKGAGIVAIKPFPLQFEHKLSGGGERGWRNELRLSDFPKDEEIAKEKLRAYYSKLGFVGLGGTPFMLLSTALWLPVP